MTYAEYIAQLPAVQSWGRTDHRQRIGDERCVDLLVACCAPRQVQFSGKDWPKVLGTIRAWNRQQWKAARISENALALVLPKKSKPTKKLKE